MRWPSRLQPDDARDGIGGELEVLGEIEAEREVRSLDIERYCGLLTIVRAALSAKP